MYVCMCMSVVVYVRRCTCAYACMCMCTLACTFKVYYDVYAFAYAYVHRGTTIQGTFNTWPCNTRAAYNTCPTQISVFQYNSLAYNTRLRTPSDASLSRSRQLALQRPLYGDHTRHPRPEKADFISLSNLSCSE